MNLIERITSIITPSAASLGYDIVLVKFNDTAKRRTLQIMAERSSDKLMGIDDCERLSRTISALLDVEDVIEGQYALEVGSPGIDRPLTRRDDFSRYAGFETKIELALPLEGRRRFKGDLKGIEGDMVQIEADGKLWELPFEGIQSAQLVLTDKLIKASQAQMKMNESARGAEDVKEITD